ncbi:no significant blast hit, conidia-enriched transcript [Histoplasma capsulatum]|uniref:No significant blast hit, conidia-enriched transcript n=1 Tax=Ajellomyces capsulatus TaxID=5037 RepID=A0A8A1MBD1_AJECA|nr:no significant blast hit, conidia-enriched transcript [Histoplasma capsulatum]
MAPAAAWFILGRGKNQLECLGFDDAAHVAKRPSPLAVNGRVDDDALSGMKAGDAFSSNSVKHVSVWLTCTVPLQIAVDGTATHGRLLAAWTLKGKRKERKNCGQGLELKIACRE